MLKQTDVLAFILEQKVIAAKEPVIEQYVARVIPVMDVIPVSTKLLNRCLYMCVIVKRLYNR